MSKQHELPLLEPQAQQENTRLQARLVKAIEMIRFTGAAIAIALGLKSSNPEYRLSAALFVFFLAGITGLESLFLGKISARSKKWDEGSPYQIQSGCNNLASTVAMIILLSIGASDAALATLMMTVTIFLQLSGINHFVTVIADKMKGKDIAWIHFLRMFFATCISVAVGFTLAKWRPFNSSV
jgi:hypothetical protein